VESSSGPAPSPLEQFVGAILAGLNFIGQHGWLLTLLLVAFPAAFLACLDTVVKLKLQEPSAALRTKEWWQLCAVNFLLASLLIYGFAYAGNRIDLSTFFGVLGAILGYPLLLNAKILTIRGDSPEDERSVGVKIVLDLADVFLVPGIKQSIDDMGVALLEKWHQRHQLNPANLAHSIQNYLATHDLPANYPRTRDQLGAWVNQLRADTAAHPENAQDNARALFIEIRQLGGLRAVRRIIRLTTP